MKKSILYILFAIVGITAVESMVQARYWRGGGWGRGYHRWGGYRRPFFGFSVGSPYYSYPYYRGYPYWNGGYYYSRPGIGFSIGI